MADNENPTPVPPVAPPANEDPGTPLVPTPPAPETPVVEGDEDKPLFAEEARAIRLALKNANKEAEKNRLKLKEIDDAKLSELQRVQRDAEEAKAEAANLRSENLRSVVALETGLPAKWVSRLVGATEDELRADAASILADLNKTRQPAPDPSQGPRSNALTPEDSFYESIYGKQA